MIVEAPAVKVAREPSRRIWRIECNARCSHINSLPIPRLAFSDGNPRLKGMTRKQLVLAPTAAMTVSIDEITAAALALPAEARAELADRMAASIASGISPHVRRAQLEEVQKRRTEVLSGEVQGVSSQQVRDGIASLLK